eukprot:GFUD01050636.1.p1 GENE.GFUD01050636.1~~GFUD01050636.1.p1  ORF type:complete len:130 (+),score=15.35 GFUD01050636.1:33-422(+)
MPEQEVNTCILDLVSSAAGMDSTSLNPPQPPFLIPSVHTSSTSSSWASVSSSGPDFRPVHPDMIRRNLKRVFMEAGSLPGKIDHHKLRPSARELERLRSRLPCQKIPVNSSATLFKEKDGKDFMFRLEL